MSCLSWLCYGDRKALIHNTARTATTLPKLLSHINTEKASIQPVQLPHTYTIVVYQQCYTLMHDGKLVHKTTHNTRESSITTQPGLQLSLWQRQENSTQPEQPSRTFWLHNRTGDRDSTAYYTVYYWIVMNGIMIIIRRIWSLALKANFN